MAHKPEVPSADDPEDPLSPISLLKASISRVPANKYALGVVGVVAAAALCIRVIGGNWLVAIGGGTATFIGMLLLRVFARPIPGSRVSLQATVLSWVAILAFVVVVSILLGALYRHVYPPAPVDDSLVPVTIKAVYRDDFNPARTILTVRKLDGQVILQEVLTDSNGLATVHLPKGNYSLAAVQSPNDLNFQVSAPSTALTIQLNRPQPLSESSHNLQQPSSQPEAQEKNENRATVAHPTEVGLSNDFGKTSKPSEDVNIDEGHTVGALNNSVFISVVGIRFEGNPLRNRVSFRVALAGSQPTLYVKKDVGEVVKQGRFLIRIIDAGVSSARFRVDEITSKTAKNNP
jgi:hypothetical protein